MKEYTVKTVSPHECPYCGSENTDLEYEEYENLGMICRDCGKDYWVELEYIPVAVTSHNNRTLWESSI